MLCNALIPSSLQRIAWDLLCCCLSLSLHLQLFFLGAPLISLETKNPHRAQSHRSLAAPVDMTSRAHTHTHTRISVPYVNVPFSPIASSQRISIPSSSRRHAGAQLSNIRFLSERRSCPYFQVSPPLWRPHARAFFFFPLLHPYQKE